MTRKNIISPPKIIHGERKPSKQDMPEIINSVVHNAKLNKKQAALLSFYANRSNGFTPAEELVIRETGISERRLRNVRNSLQRMNLIDYQYSNGFHFIFVNWLVIRGLAMLDHPLDVGGKEHNNFNRMDQLAITKHPRHYELEQMRTKPLKSCIGPIPKELPNNLQHWFQIVGDWTAEEYTFIVDALMRAENVKPIFPIMEEEPFYYRSPAPQDDCSVQISNDEYQLNQTWPIQTEQEVPLPF